MPTDENWGVSKPVDEEPASIDGTIPKRLFTYNIMYYGRPLQILYKWVYPITMSQWIMMVQLQALIKTSDVLVS